MEHAKHHHEKPASSHAAEKPKEKAKPRHEKHSSEGFLGKHRAWLNGSFKDALLLETVTTIAGGALLTLAGVTLPIWMLAALAAPFTLGSMMAGKGDKKSKKEGHGH